MKKNRYVASNSQNEQSVGEHQHSLLTLLLKEASRRGDSATRLAQALGITYVRLGQWRRGEAKIENASRDVIVRAAKYLHWPTLYVLMRAGKVRLEDFAWPQVDVPARVEVELLRMCEHPEIGPLVPGELGTAHWQIKLFVVHLFLEMESSRHACRGAASWLDELAGVIQRHVEGSE